MATAQLNLTSEKSIWQTAPGNSLVTFDQWKVIRSTMRLTGRELDVCRLLFDGKTRTEVSNDLGLKFSTVRQYTEQLHEKLRVHSRVELVLRIIQVRDWLAAQARMETGLR